MDLAEETAEMLGRLPRRIRTAHIAEATGLCKVWLSRFENGGHPQPNLDKVRRLHAFLRTHLPASASPQRLPVAVAGAITCKDMARFGASIAAVPSTSTVRTEPKAVSPVTVPAHAAIGEVRNAPLAYTVAETTRKLGVSQRLVYRMLSDGTLRRVKVGRRTLIPADAVHTLAGRA